MSETAITAPPTTLAVWMTGQRISDRQLAHQIGKHYSLVCKVRTGRRPATSDFQLAFARVYGPRVARALFPDFPLEDDV